MMWRPISNLWFLVLEPIFPSSNFFVTIIKRSISLFQLQTILLSVDIIILAVYYKMINTFQPYPMAISFGHTEKRNFGFLVEFICQSLRMRLFIEEKKEGKILPEFILVIQFRNFVIFIKSRKWQNCWYC